MHFPKPVPYAFVEYGGLRYPVQNPVTFEDEPGEVDYSDMSCGDLVAELQLCIETQETPPLDLTARLMGFGYDVEALIGDMSKITRH